MIPCIRAAALDGYVPLATSLGLDPTRETRRAGLDPTDLAAPERWVPAAAAARLLETSAVDSGAEDLGVRLSEWRRLATLGPLSVVLREEPDLHSALLLLIRHERSCNEAVSLRLSAAGGLATLSVRLVLGAPAPTRQALELAVAAVHGIVRELRGPGWHAAAVCFPHRAPERLDSHRRLFGARLRFGSDTAAVVFRAADLGEPNVLADPLLRPYRPELLQLLPAPRARTVAGRVRDLVETLLPVGRATMPRIARSLGVTPRTLHRHLGAEGTSYLAVVDEARSGLAERYLADDRLSLADIAQHLGFAAPSAFSRWFRRRFGISPSAWRQEARAPGPSGDRAGALRR